MLVGANWTMRVGRPKILLGGITIIYTLWNTFQKGNYLYRLQKQTFKPGQQVRQDVYHSHTDEDFQKTMNKNGHVDWQENHGHEVSENNEVQYQRENPGSGPTAKGRVVYPQQK